MLAVTNTLSGTASLNAHNGALAGINVEQLLRRLERRPLSGNGDFRTGRTPFDQFMLADQDRPGPSFRRRHASDGPAVRLAVGGQVSVPTRDLDLKGVATLVSSETANEFDLPFVVQGQWDDPIMLPDAQSLIRRSGAAAPLLECDQGPHRRLRGALGHRQALAAPTGATGAAAPRARKPPTKLHPGGRRRARR